MGSRIAFGYDFDNYENFQNITTWKKELPLLSCDLPKEITLTVQKSLRISNLKLAVIIIIFFFYTENQMELHHVRLRNVALWQVYLSALRLNSLL